MKKYINNIIALLMALLLVIFIWHNLLVSANNVVFIFLFIICYIIIKSLLDKKINKRMTVVASIISLLFAIIEVVCKSINLDFTLNHIIDKWTFINLIGYFTITWIIIQWIYNNFENNTLNIITLKEIRNKFAQNKILNNEFFIMLLCIILIFIAWIPYFLRYYPGIVTSDSYSQIEQMIGRLPLSNHHPIAHTAIIGIFINLGLLLFNNINIGIAFYSIASMLIMAICDSLVLKYLRKKKVPIIVRIIILLFYMFYPVNAMYSITMWKDVLFSGIVPIFIILSMELILNSKEFLAKKRSVFTYIIVSLLTIFLRHNGLYVVILTLPFILIVLRKHLKKLLVMFAIIIISYCSINILLFNVFKVEKGATSEMLSVPIQQIARTVNFHEEELDNETIEKVNRYFKEEYIWREYNPILSDPVKFKFNNDYFNDHKSEFVSLWIKLLQKYPKEYIEAFISNSYGYYYPEAQNAVVSRATMDHNMGIKQTPIIKGRLVEKIDSLTDVRSIPVFSMIFSIGIGFWLTIICLGYKIYQKEYKYILIYLPIFILWLTLIASPAYCEFRYAYPIFMALPLYISINFVKGKEQKMEKIAILIPCYNEELTIEKVIKDFKRELPNAQIYVYNNSKDKTEQIAKENGAIVINEYKQGKGNVVRSQFRDVDADIYVMVDGDDTYPAEFVHKLIEPVKNGEADMAIGDRLSNGTYQKENKRHFHEFGNNLVKKAINVLFKTNLNDIMTGYRVFNKRFVKNMPVLSPKFEIETEMSLYALDKRYIIKEIPIIYRDRPEGSSSKLNTISDGIKVVKTIARMFKDYKPFKFFGIIGLIFLVLGLAVGIPVLVEFFKTSYITKVPSAILATGFIGLAAISFQCSIILDTITRQHRENYELNILRYEQIEHLRK